MAAMDGRFNVAIEDIRRVAVPVLRHRLSTNFQAQAEGMTTDKIILRLLKEIKEPAVPKYTGIDAAAAQPPAASAAQPPTASAARGGKSSPPPIQ